MPEKTLASLIEDIVKSSRYKEPSQFVHDSLGDLCTYFDCDSAGWINYSSSYKPLGVTLYNLDESVIADFLATMNTEENIKYFNATIGLGKVVDGNDVIDQTEITGETEHDKYSEKHGVGQGIGYSYHHTNTSTYTNIHLNRASLDDFFSTKEKEEMEIAFPAVIESAKNCLYLYFLKQVLADKESTIAICTRDGNILLEEITFESLMSTEFPNYDKRKISGLDLGTVKDSSTKNIHNSNSMLIDVEPCGDLIVLRIKTQGIFAKLSEKEKEVALKVMEGKTSKQIAREHDVSTHTAKRQRENIYKKLDVHSVGELTSKYIDQIKK